MAYLVGMSAILIDSLRHEFLRYKALAQGAFAQVPDDKLTAHGPDHANSIGVICWHVAGNFQSRFTEFLTSDGEKPWRHREEEFADRTVTRAELMEKWELGWATVLDALNGLTDADLGRTVTIRRQPLFVHEALNRSLAHVAYHVGQIVFIAKGLQGPDWKFLSIAPGKSDEYARNATMERAADHAQALGAKDRH